MSRYLVITADAHAGLPLPQYREWVEPRYRQAFDDRLEEDLAFRNWERDTFLDKAFEEEWKRGRVPEGINGAWNSDERNRQLDADGISGEVVFPDGVTELNTPPFQAGFTLPVGPGIDPELQWAGGARAQPLGGELLRGVSGTARGARPRPPALRHRCRRVRDPPGARGGSAWHRDPRDLPGLRALPPPALRAGLAGLRRARDGDPHARRGRTRLRGLRRRGHHGDLHDGVRLVGLATGVVPDLGRRLRAPSRAQVHRHRARRHLGAAHQGA